MSTLHLLKRFALLVIATALGIVSTATTAAPIQYKFIGTLQWADTALAPAFKPGSQFSGTLGYDLTAARLVHQYGNGFNASVGEYDDGFTLDFDFGEYAVEGRPWASLMNAYAPGLTDELDFDLIGNTNMSTLELGGYRLSRVSLRLDTRSLDFWDNTALASDLVPLWNPNLYPTVYMSWVKNDSVIFSGGYLTRVVDVQEPGGFALSAAGLVGLYAARRRAKRHGRRA
jgi:hypothetical protein